MLEADFQLKKSVARLIHPDTETGKAFWDALGAGHGRRGSSATCLSFRQWIVPGSVLVRTTPSSIYVVDAPLDVKLEAEYLRERGVRSGADCAAASDRSRRHGERVYRRIVLPRLVQQVNEAPEYEALRRIFAARVIAEWYKRRSRTEELAYSSLVGRDHVEEWYSRRRWSPTAVFRRYVRSASEGEFRLTRRVVEGNAVVVRTYFYGGVDLSSVRWQRVDKAELLRHEPLFEQQLAGALFNPAGFRDGGVRWVGGIASAPAGGATADAEEGRRRLPSTSLGSRPPSRDAAAPRTGQRAHSPLVWIAALALGLLLVAVATARVRRSRW
jgi:hypothetical protein